MDTLGEEDQSEEWWACSEAGSEVGEDNDHDVGSNIDGNDDFAEA
jgi:hypothetical protein